MSSTTTQVDQIIVKRPIFESVRVYLPGGKRIGLQRWTVDFPDRNGGQGPVKAGDVTRGDYGSDPGVMPSAEVAAIIGRAERVECTLADVRANGILFGEIRSDGLGGVAGTKYYTSCDPRYAGGRPAELKFDSFEGAAAEAARRVTANPRRGKPALAGPNVWADAAGHIHDPE